MKFFKSLIPNNLKRMIIFKDLNETYISAMPSGLMDILDPEPIRNASTKVTKELAEASLDLEHLSAAFITDARQFWEVRQPNWIWEQLQTLSLTSRDLVPHKNPEDINELMYSAALAISKMPKLQLMELWNGGKGYAAVFRYKTIKASGRAMIAWRSSWALNFETRVVTAWENIADASYAGYLQVQNELLASSQIRSHGEAVLMLELEAEVVCPVSIQQIHREHLPITA
jgi:hypothetical protein